jgi:hypothetical protein
MTNCKFAQIRMPINEDEGNQTSKLKWERNINIKNQTDIKVQRSKQRTKNRGKS